MRSSARVQKRHIDAEVARLLDMPVEKVSLITGCFVRTLLQQLVESGVVNIEGFGRFCLTEQKKNEIAKLRKGCPTFQKGKNAGEMPRRVRRKFRVFFRKAKRFKQALEDTYGSSSDAIIQYS